jgi:hypothetical protein
MRITDDTYKSCEELTASTMFVARLNVRCPDWIMQAAPQNDRAF